MHTIWDITTLSFQCIESFGSSQHIKTVHFIICIVSISLFIWDPCSVLHEVYFFIDGCFTFVWYSKSNKNDVESGLRDKLYSFVRRSTISYLGSLRTLEWMASRPGNFLVFHLSIRPRAPFLTILYISSDDSWKNLFRQGYLPYIFHSRNS